ncbi:ParB N-terminal domain-containing protein [Kiloniella laminariae]|uniref:ParB N-terminal domain-containing protein n=1 Tax=Kiloniella laminariae TaxID=454162 RepID=A0ABT4LEC9_9PROT|nr:ParB N-terminal domain-containing protein [Kiloniella laminariae]MCZ4279453.1 ParB N-terminal domain-containing protein [Kiloniella laminariae]
MLKAVAIKIDDIYIPADRRKERDPARIESFAENIIDEVEVEPIRVRKGKDKNKYVLVRGVNRLEARKELGDETIFAYVVQALQR